MGKKKKSAPPNENEFVQSAALFDSHDGTGQCDVSTEHVQQRYLRDRTRRAMFCLERVNLIEARTNFPEIGGV